MLLLYMKLFFFVIIFCYLDSDGNGVPSWSSWPVDNWWSWRKGSNCLYTI